MTYGRPKNPLALAMLAMLAERPMHPYQIASTLRERHGEDAIKIRFGSLYSVIAQLVSRDWVVAHETAQKGKRPEHTKYKLTKKGRTELTSWMRDLIARPTKEYPQFEAALCLMAVLPYDEVADRLRERLTLLEATARQLQSDINGALSEGLDPLFVAEAEYRLAMIKAERDFCRGLQTKVARRAAPTKERPNDNRKK